jgi:nucleotide-binding universal stress UspA family protein
MIGGEKVGGTILCDVTDTPAAESAAGFANALGERLGLRVVLAYVVDGTAARARDSVTGRQQHSGAERALVEVARGLGGEVETRLVAGDHAEALARVAAEEGADLVIVGARAVGLGGRNLRCTLVRDLEAATPVPVLVAPPSTRTRSRRRLAPAANAGTH